METAYDYTEEIAYVTERATAEGSIPRYLNTEFGGKRSLVEMVASILRLDGDFLNMMETGDERVPEYSNLAEYDWIAEETGYSTEMIETVLWFNECFLMANNRSQYMGNCKKCGHDVLYLREGGSDMFECYIECEQCGERSAFWDDEMDEDSEEEGNDNGED